MIPEEVKELVPPGSPLPESGDPDAPAAPIPEGSPVKCGYAIGIREDGTFLFDIFGSDLGIVELLGLHTIARERIEARMDNQLGGKFSLVIDKLNQILGTP
jgi:hypothetical protein